MAETTLRVEQFPSGQVYGYVLPNVQRMLLSGFFPEPVVPLVRQFVSSKLDTEAEQSDDDIRAWEEFKARLVAWMVRTEGGKVQPWTEDGIVVRDPSSGMVEHEVQSTGKPVTFTWEQVADPEQFPADDLTALFSRAIRVVPAPKAVRAKV